MDKSLIDTVKEKLVERGMNPRQLALATGISVDRIYKWINKGFKPKEVDATILRNWIDGKLDKEVVPNEPSREQLGPTYLQQRWLGKVTDEPHFVPLLPVTARAGYAHSYDNVDYIEKLETYQMPPGLPWRGAEWRWVEVGGDSMEPVLQEGDILLCSVVPHADWKEIDKPYIYVIVWQDEVSVKRVLYDKGDFILFSENLESEPNQIRVPTNNVKELLKVRRQLNARFPISGKFKIKV